MVELMLIGRRLEIRALDEQKKLLRLSFGEKRNMNCLIEEMVVMEPNKNGNFFSFG